MTICHSFFFFKILKLVSSCKIGDLCAWQMAHSHFAAEFVNAGTKIVYVKLSFELVESVYSLLLKGHQRPFKTYSTSESSDPKLFSARYHWWLVMDVTASSAEDFSPLFSVLFYPSRIPCLGDMA